MDIKIEVMLKVAKVLEEHKETFLAIQKEINNIEKNQKIIDSMVVTLDNCINELQEVATF